MTIVFKDDRVASGLSRLLSQFKDSPNVEGLLSSFLEELQLFENSIEEVSAAFDIDTAIGVQLDVLGRIVGQPREGRIDDVYRLWINARILINQSSGTAEEIYQVVSLLTGDMAPGSFKIEENYPAGFLFTIYNSISQEDVQTIKDIVELMKPICVDFNIVYHITDPLFTFDLGPGFDQGHLAGII